MRGVGVTVSVRSAVGCAFRREIKLDRLQDFETELEVSPWASER